ncbi:MAG: DUF1893 domain-containing protein [Bacilli bacterium]
MTLQNKYIQDIRENKSTLIIVNGQKLIVDENNFGVISLVKEYYNLKNSCSKLYIYDKLVGKGASLLIRDFDVKFVFAKTITNTAYKLLKDVCEVKYDRIVPHILNRTHSDLCPIEKIANNYNKGEELYLELKKFYEERGFIND